MAQSKNIASSSQVPNSTDYSDTSKQENKVAEKIVTMIYQGKTWKHVKNKLSMNMPNIRKVLIQHYEKSGGKNSIYYKRLQAMQRLNTKCKKEETMTNTTFQEENVVQTSFLDQLFSASKDKPIIHLIESGYIMTAGLTLVKRLVDSNKGNVVIPLFCYGELEMLAEDYFESVEQFLEGDIQNNIISLFSQHERLMVEPKYSVSRRIRGIIAIALDLVNAGLRVCIHTNSAELLRIIHLQGKDITVHKICSQQSTHPSPVN